MQTDGNHLHEAKLQLLVFYYGKPARLRTLHSQSFRLFAADPVFDTHRLPSGVHERDVPFKMASRYSP